MPKMTQSAYSRHLGVSRQAVGVAVKSGRISLVGGMCDPDRNDHEWIGNSAPAQSKVLRTNGGGGGKGLPAYSESRAAREAYQAAKARLDLELQKRSLVSADEIKSAWVSAATKVKSAVLGIPDKLAPAVVGLSDPMEAKALLMRECELILRALHGDLEPTNI